MVQCCVNENAKVEALYIVAAGADKGCEQVLGFCWKVISIWSVRQLSYHAIATYSSHERRSSAISIYKHGAG